MGGQASRQQRRQANKQAAVQASRQAAVEASRQARRWQASKQAGRQGRQQCRQAGGQAGGSASRQARQASSKQAGGRRQAGSRPRWIAAGGEPRPSTALPPALAQPGPASNPAEAKYK